VRRTIIIGSIPAEYTRAIDAGRARLDPLLAASPAEADDKLLKATEAENFTGFPGGTLGPNLIVKTEQH
jgi:thioredoxin reductase (NADPH)